MFSKFKVTSVSSAFTTHLSLIEVYEAEIRRLRGEKEFFKTSEQLVGRPAK